MGQQWASVLSFLKKVYSKHYTKDIITDRNVKLWKKLEELADYKSQVMKETTQSFYESMIAMFNESFKKCTACTTNQVHNEIEDAENDKVVSIVVVEENEEEQQAMAKQVQRKLKETQDEDEFKCKMDIILAK